MQQIGENDITKKTRKKVFRRRGKIVVYSRQGKKDITKKTRKKVVRRRNRTVVDVIDVHLNVYN